MSTKMINMLICNDWLIFTLQVKKINEDNVRQLELFNQRVSHFFNFLYNPLINIFLCFIGHVLKNPSIIANFYPQSTSI